MVSGAYQNNSAIHIHVFILSQTPLPSRLPHNIEQFHRVGPYWFSSVQFSSVAQSCSTLQPQELQHARPPCPSLPEFTQTHVHQVSDAIQPSHTLLSPFPPAPNPSLVAQWVKCLPTMWETQVRSLGREDPLEKEMATHSSTLAWKIPWTEKPGRLQSMGSQRVGHD